MFELTFAQEYGPRIVLTVILLIVGACLTVIGRGAARAYERAINSAAEHFKSMTKGRRRRKRDSIRESQQELAEKARNARRLETIALCATTTAIVALWVRTALDLIDWDPTARSLVAIAVAALALGALLYLRSRVARTRAERLRPAIDLEVKETSAP